MSTAGSMGGGPFGASAVPGVRRGRSPATAVFPLDTLAPPRIAYALRRLLASYSGPAVRVRRASDNAEVDIGFTGSGDLDGAALTAHCGASSGFVKTWYDQSGSGSNATQATLAVQPRIVNAGVPVTLSGRPALSFAGSYLAYSGAGLPATADNLAVLIAMANDSITTLSSLVGLAPDAARIQFNAPWSDGNFYWDVGAAGGANRVSGVSGMTNGTATQLTALHSTTDSLQAVRRDGVVRASDASAQASIGVSFLGIGKFGADALAGRVGECYLYAVPPSTLDLVGIERAQGTYYGVAMP